MQDKQLMSTETAQSLRNDLVEAMDKDPSTKVFTALNMCIRNLESGAYGMALYNFVSDSDKYCRNNRHPGIQEIYNRYKIPELYVARLT